MCRGRVGVCRACRGRVGGVSGACRARVGGVSGVSGVCVESVSGACRGCVGGVSGHVSSGFRHFMFIKVFLLTNFLSKGLFLQDFGQKPLRMH